MFNLMSVDSEKLSDRLIKRIAREDPQKALVQKKVELKIETVYCQI